MDSVGAVVPAYQAATILRPTLAELTTRLPVVVVDDGSTDGTAEIAHQAGAWQVLRQDRRRGPGAAVHAGFSFLQEHHFEVGVVLDADGQMDVDALDHLLSPLRKGQAALVRGSRFEPDSGACTVPWLRRQAARSLTPLASQRVGQSIRDPLSGYVALDLNYLPDWLWPGYGYPIHLAAQVGSEGGKITHVPVPSRRPQGGVSRHGLHRLFTVGGALWASGRFKHR